MLKELHDTPSGGHLGSAKTIELANRHFFWPNMHEEIRHYISTCIILSIQ